jgi:hypothetical protein
MRTRSFGKRVEAGNQFSPRLVVQDFPLPEASFEIQSSTAIGMNFIRNLNLRRSWNSFHDAAHDFFVVAGGLEPFTSLLFCKKSAAKTLNDTGKNHSLHERKSP